MIFFQLLYFVFKSLKTKRKLTECGKKTLNLLAKKENKSQLTFRYYSLSKSNL